MNAQQSNGSKLGAIGGILIIIGFFTPWLRGCGQDISGYDLASSEGFIQAPGMLWLVLIAGVLNILIYFLVKTNKRSGRFVAALLRLFSAIAASSPLLFQWLDWGSEFDFELRIGGYLTAGGILANAFSFFVDAFGSAAQNTANLSTASINPAAVPRSSPSPGSSTTPNQPLPSEGSPMRYCVHFGTQLTAVANFCVNCGAQQP